MLAVNLFSFQQIETHFIDMTGQCQPFVSNGFLFGGAILFWKILRVPASETRRSTAVTCPHAGCNQRLKNP
jgi:hypothetical protein